MTFRVIRALFVERLKQNHTDAEILWNKNESLRRWFRGEEIYDETAPQIKIRASDEQLLCFIKFFIASKNNKMLINLLTQNSRIRLLIYLINSEETTDLIRHIIHYYPEMDGYYHPPLIHASLETILQKLEHLPPINQVKKVNMDTTHIKLPEDYLTKYYHDSKNNNNLHIEEKKLDTYQNLLANVLKTSSAETIIQNPSLSLNFINVRTNIFNLISMTKPDLTTDETLPSSPIEEFDIDNFII